EPPLIAGAPGPTVPTPLPVVPKPLPTPPAPPHQVGTPLAVAFAPRSAILPADATAALRQLATKRGTATIEVTGFGETASSDPRAQSAALGLGLSRAQAMAAALAKGGVPAASIRIAATAAGRGGVARLIQ
ncbi:MAG: OmpA family protein, partial [Acetobacteraceae bacterium]|nr:OmpA family protein [Acetobacteraceae bacterium]